MLIASEKVWASPVNLMLNGKSGDPKLIGSLQLIRKNEKWSVGTKTGSFENLKCF
jgi:hypothetical protein